MMEFVLSRIWMVVAGLAVMAVIISSFSGLDRSVGRDIGLEGANALSDVVSDLQREKATGELRVNIGEMIQGASASFLIYEWGIEVQGTRSDGAVSFLDRISMIDQNRRAVKMEVGPADVLVISASSGEVQLEKVSTI